MRLWPSLILATALAGPVLGQPDTILHGAIARELQANADGEVLAVLAARLAGDVELPEVPKPAPLTGGPMKVIEGDVQAALTQLSILAGGNGHLSLQLAQTIEWAQVMRQAFERGARVFLQLGPGNALARMVAPAYPCCEVRAVEEFQSLEGAAAWVRSALERLQ